MSFPIASLGPVLALALAPAPAPAPPEQRPPVSTEAVVRLVAGRATLVQGDEVDHLARVGRSWVARGASYLELGPGGEVEIAWNGLASLRVTGPAALEWERKPYRGPHVRVLRLKRLEVETRRGGLRLDLGQGWTLELERAALHAAHRFGGGIDVIHHGGTPIRVRSGAEAPWSLAPGARTVLSNRVRPPGS